MQVYRALIKTHHMTSRKKITTLTKSASHLNCSVLLKTGSCPGIMLCEASTLLSMQDWVEGVRKLRYKDYQLMKKEMVILAEKERALRGIVDRGQVVEIDKLSDFGKILGDGELHAWWRRAMGYVREGD